MSSEVQPAIAIDSYEAHFNRETSWLAFARRVLALVEDRDVPLLERVKFAGIMGMLHDEFFMKRVGGLTRQQRNGPSGKRSIDGHTPTEELQACRAEIREQMRVLAHVVEREIRPALAEAGIPILDHGQLDEAQRRELREHFEMAVLPILTPLAVDAEHPFPFISNQGLNLAIEVREQARQRQRFVRLKVPTNRPRWVELRGGGFVPLEQVIGANLDLLFPDSVSLRTYLFRVTRGAEGDPREVGELRDADWANRPGSIIRLVTRELKARRFAGVVRLKVSHDMPERLQRWLAEQLEVDREDVYATESFIGINELLQLPVRGHDELRYPAHEPVTHPRLRGLPEDEPAAIFEELGRGDVLLHHPYHCFDTSVLRFLQSAAVDPQVLAIKLTIYRTSSDSPIVRALAEASRRGKQVAVLVEITARFDEAPNIAWGKLLEQEGVHVAYGVERLKTHVKLALVVREEGGRLRRYAHVGTGNYHTGTARIYEDIGLLTADRDLCHDVASVFNQLTAGGAPTALRRFLVAPETMRARFIELLRREAEHARAGRPSGVRAKLNQLQDTHMIGELYAAGQAGVPIQLIVRGLCCLRPGVPGLSENIRVCSVVGRFLEHSRVYEFANGGHPESYIGSADWMRRNLDKRVETICPVTDPRVAQEVRELLDVYDGDNASAWDCAPDGTYVRRRPAEGEPRRAAQEVFIERVRTS